MLRLKTALNTPRRGVFRAVPLQAGDFRIMLKSAESRARLHQRKGQREKSRPLALSASRHLQNFPAYATVYKLQIYGAQPCF